jgi:hypothetical protein
MIWKPYRFHIIVNINILVWTFFFTIITLSSLVTDHIRWWITRQKNMICSQKRNVSIYLWRLFQDMILFIEQLPSILALNHQLSNVKLITNEIIEIQVFYVNDAILYYTWSWASVQLTSPIQRQICKRNGEL